MIQFITFFSGLILCTSALFSQYIDYKVSMPNPSSHYFHIEADLINFKEKEIELKMPVWAPGSYLVREFSKNVNLVKAYDELGNPLPVSKSKKNAWIIKRGNAKKVRVNYEVYAFELSVRTSFLDLTHGFISGSGVFMYTESSRNNPGKVKVTPYEGFKKISTALLPHADNVVGDGVQTFGYTNFDQLVDCPIEVGNQTTFSFNAAGVNHDVAIYAEGNYDVEALKKDMARIVEEATKVFGQNPNKNYTFIIHNVTDGQGGLEHSNSTVLSVNRWTYQGSAYQGLLSLVAHEYFHLWNVKRIRPIELGPFNYDEENYTTLLWVMEGFTSYYDELLLLRAGYYTQDQYIQKLMGTIGYVEGSIGSRIQPVAHASFDAWIKAYRPNENSRNTTMTYYSRGQMLAALLDAYIIYKSPRMSQKCLDDFLRRLYDEFYVKKGRGFSEQEFQKCLSDFIGEDMTWFFEKYVNGTEIPDFDYFFSRVGLRVTKSEIDQPDFGASVSQSGSSVIITYIKSGSSAENAGLSVNDEIIGCNGYRVDKNDLEKITLIMEEGDNVQLLISRDNVLYSIDLVMQNDRKIKFSHEWDASEESIRLRNYWLR